MQGSRSTTSFVVTLTVGLATLFALALPEGVGGRDSVVRLTRGGLHRIRCADTASHDHEIDACVEAVSAPVPDSPQVSGAPPLAALVARGPVLTGPTAYTVAAVRRARAVRPLAPPGHATSGRAPPAC